MTPRVLLAGLFLIPGLLFGQEPTPPPTLSNPPKDAVRDVNGLVVQVLKPGTGSVQLRSPDFARLRVTAWSSDGGVVLHTPEPESMTVRVAEMLPGWSTSVVGMVEGEVRRAWVPFYLGAGRITHGETWLIETELLEIVDARAPADVASPPADALQTPSRIAYRVISRTDGKLRPSLDSEVVVHYSGWTTDGTMFESTVLRGEPVTLSLELVPAGWRELLPLLAQGDKARIWMPSTLAYGGEPGRPKGMLVFDLEVLEVREIGPYAEVQGRQLVRKTPSEPPSSLDTPPPDALRLESGLIIQTLRKGSGTESPTKNDFVQVRGTVWKSDGTLVQHITAPQSTISRVSRMLPGWSAALMRMVEGEVTRAWIPASLAWEQLPDGEFYLIETELLEIHRFGGARPQLGQVPEDATETPTGLAFTTIRPGIGGDRPSRRSRVTVHYTGWSADGKLFDSSIPAGEPIPFQTQQVIAGWTEMLQKMTRGEKVRVWVPAVLARGGGKGTPDGMLIYDIELIDFDEPAATVPSAGREGRE